MDIKECFGVLDKIFPIDSDGLRKIASQCHECVEKHKCLKSAISSDEGIEMRSEIISRAPSTGLFDRIRKWSLRKELSREKDKRSEE